MSHDRPTCAPSLSGRYAAVLAALEALEADLRERASAVAEVAGSEDCGGWQQLEAAADAAMGAAATVRVSKSHVHGARLRGVEAT